jgi:hypothetical protein
MIMLSQVDELVNDDILDDARGQGEVPYFWAKASPISSTRPPVSSCSPSTSRPLPVIRRALGILADQAPAGIYPT